MQIDDFATYNPLLFVLVHLVDVGCWNQCARNEAKGLASFNGLQFLSGGGMGQHWVGDTVFEGGVIWGTFPSLLFAGD